MTTFLEEWQLGQKKERFEEALRCLSLYVIGKNHTALMELIFEILLYHRTLPQVKLHIDQSAPMVENSGFYDCSTFNSTQTIRWSRKFPHNDEIMQHFSALKQTMPSCFGIIDDLPLFEVHSGFLAHTATTINATDVLQGVHSGFKAHTPLDKKSIVEEMFLEMFSEVLKNSKDGVLQIEVGGFEGDTPAHITVSANLKMSNPNPIEYTTNAITFRRKICNEGETSHYFIPLRVHNLPYAISIHLSFTNSKEHSFSYKLKLHSIAIPFSYNSL